MTQIMFYCMKTVARISSNNVSF